MEEGGGSFLSMSSQKFSKFVQSQDRSKNIPSINCLNGTNSVFVRGVLGKRDLKFD